MRKLVLVGFVVVAPLLLAAGSPAGSGWSELGGSGTGSGISASPGVASVSPSVAFDGGGYPVVAWSEIGPGSYQCYVKKWDGTAWVGLGGSATGGGISSSVDWSFPTSVVVRVDSAGHPVVAWVEVGFGALLLGGPTPIRVKKWDGAGWVDYAGSGSSTGISATATTGGLAMELDASDYPVVAWVNKAGSVSQIYLKRWNGSTWVELGGSATDGGVSAATTVAMYPSMALDASGNPTLTWVNGTVFIFPIGSVYLKRWNGSSWEELGGSATGSGLSPSGVLVTARSPVAIGPAGRPVVAMSLGTAGIVVKRWADGWSPVDGSATGAIPGTGSMSGSPWMEIDTSGLPMVAWREAGEIYLKRWNGTAWTEVRGSATGGGISDTPFPTSDKPEIALDPDGNPGVVWEEDASSGVADIFFRYVTPQTAPTSLAQFQADGVTSIPTGGPASSTTVVVKGTISSAVPGLTVKLDVEAQLVASPSNGSSSGGSASLPSDSQASVTLTGLQSASWRWRAQAVDSEGVRSTWVSFGGNPEWAADFLVGLPPPPPPPPSPPGDDGGGDSGGGGGCSASASGSSIALLALLAAAAAALARR